MSAHSPLETLPDGLPPGRLITPDSEFADPRWADREVMWVSDEPLRDAGRQWTRLYEMREKTGLYPLLLSTLRGESDRPWHAAELDGFVSLGAIDVLGADGVLCRMWESVTEEEELGPLSGPWPGLAGFGSGDTDPDQAARALAGSYGDRLLGLVPADRGADTPAVLGWQGPVNHIGEVQEVSAVLRSWEDRFGARLVHVGFAELDLAVAAPPLTAEHARELAAEHFAFCPDTIWQGTPFDDYAAGLVGNPRWSFWWD